jgi:4-hydroxybenzoyl-CoA thioesterase
VIVYERPVRFEEVDAAGIVFFGRFSHYAHEAMEHFFSGLEGGYPRLIVQRRVGLPAVALAFRFARPLRYGETLLVEVVTRRLGNRSADLHYRMVDRATGELVAECDHTIVSTALGELKSTDMPADVRAILQANLQ